MVISFMTLRAKRFTIKIEEDYVGQVVTTASSCNLSFSLSCLIASVFGCLEKTCEDAEIYPSTEMALDW